MCGRFNFNGDTVDLADIIDELNKKYGPGTAGVAASASPPAASRGRSASASAELMQMQAFAPPNRRPKTGEVFPTDTAAVLVADRGVTRPVPFIWGYPKWPGVAASASPPAASRGRSASASAERMQMQAFAPPNRRPGPGTIINARAETAREKPMFRRSLEMRRCVIPSSGFFEWQRVDGQKKKDKYLFNLPGQSALYMAGLWNTFTAADGSEYPAFVILTTAANESMADIHERMPVILSADEREAWLHDRAFVDFALSKPGPRLVHVPA